MAILKKCLFFFTKVDPKLESSFRNFIYKSSLLIKVISPIRRFELSSLKDIHSFVALVL